MSWSNQSWFIYPDRHRFSSLELDIWHNLNGIWKQRKLEEMVSESFDHFLKTGLRSYLCRGDLPGKSNPLFRHKGAIDHTLHLSVMHIFYNIHIHPRIFQFLVCTVGDLSFDQLKRLLGNRTVDMWLDIGHHFLICIALPERYFKILNGYTSVRILFLERGLSYEIYFWFNPDPGQVKLKF